MYFSLTTPLFFSSFSLLTHYLLHRPGRPKPGRLKASWAEWIRGLMGDKGLQEKDWNDRDNWRKKII
jgi:hypothetical protein